MTGALVEAVRWAAANVPFYRERLGTARATFQRPEQLAELPLTTRRDIREAFPDRMIPDGADVAKLLRDGGATIETTSGSADERLSVLFDRKRWTSPLNLPLFALTGGLRELRIAQFTTPICSGTECHKGGMSYEQRRRGRAHLILDSSDHVMDLTRAELDGIVADVARFDPTVLQVDPVYGVALVRALARHALPLPRVRAIRVSYEYCSVLHRRVLEAELGAPVFGHYGAAELGGAAAFECEVAGRYHVWADELVAEVVRDGRPLPAGEVGELVVTTLRNRIMPLVRYRIGDLARMVETPCRCALRAWPAFQLEGRCKDIIRDTSALRLTTRDVDETFRGLGWIDFYQLVQRGRTAYQLIAVARDGASSEEQEWRGRAQALLGAAARIDVRYARAIAPERSLKYRLTRSDA